MARIPVVLLTVVALTACTTSTSGNVASATGGTGSTPTATTRTATTPARSTRARSTPARSTPARSTPARSTPAGSTPAGSTPVPSPSASTATTTTGPARRALARMSPAQRVGQLLMVDCPSTGVAAPTVTAIRRYDVGSIILDGTTSQGVARTRAVTDRLQSLAPPGVRLLISTDQEGGLVQRMQGPGFSTVPSAVVQGRWAPATVRSRTRQWGAQLLSAGITVDLAPVLDTVPPGQVSNPPIGDLDREFGRTPLAVNRHGVAAALGLADAGVSATVKHFPGLGRVTGNTDVTSGVTDTVTTAHDAYLAPFARAVRVGVPFVMMSTAVYSRIDPRNPAAFSHAIITGILRQQLGFQGVVVTDDVGGARQVASIPPGQRAVRLVRAGGDMVLTVDPGVVPAMVAALLRRYAAVPSFRTLVDRAALRVLRAKQARHLLG